MRKPVLAAALLVPVALLTASITRPSDEAAARPAVEDAVNAYFDGLMSSDAESLRRAFHPEARLMASRPDNGELMIIPFEQWLGYFDGGEMRDAATHANRIVSVDVRGTAAVVKTDLTWPNVHYVDYLSLLKVEGEWKIVNKIWWQERRGE